MRKLIAEEWISLDGYVADKVGKLDFFVSTIREIYDDEERLKFLQTIDTILFGRSTYEQFSAAWPHRPTDNNPLAAKINGAKKIVFSNTLTEGSWGSWPKAEIVRADTISSIRQLKSQSGGDMILWGSISLAQNLMKESLIDEFHLHVCPTLTAGGRHFFTTEINPTTLKLLDVRHYTSGTVLLKYK